MQYNPLSLQSASDRLYVSLVVLAVLQTAMHVSVLVKRCSMICTAEPRQDFGFSFSRRCRRLQDQNLRSTAATETDFRQRFLEAKNLRKTATKELPGSVWRVFLARPVSCGDPLYRIEWKEVTVESFQEQVVHSVFVPASVTVPFQAETVCSGYHRAGNDQELIHEAG